MIMLIILFVAMTITLTVISEQTIDSEPITSFKQRLLYSAIVSGIITILLSWLIILPIIGLVHII